MPPKIVGVELEPGRASEASAKFANSTNVRILEADFLLGDIPGNFDYVVGNPPYVSILGMSPSEKSKYRANYKCATGRFDLYMLFWERSLRLLNPDGRLVFITPEKYTYVASARRLRTALSSVGVESIHLLPDDTFPGFVTYPTVTTIAPQTSATQTKIISGDSKHTTQLPTNGESWRAALNPGESIETHGPVLEDICTRISCGVATGADGIFVQARRDVPESMLKFTRPTLSGRQLHADLRSATSHVMLLPYDHHGALLPLSELGEFAQYLEKHSERLNRRVCTKRKPWYAFHDSVPMSDLLCPKILCKDICEEPEFMIDPHGSIVPRHSVYYLVPKTPSMIEDIADYLNSAPARKWLRTRAQRAANGYLRVQSSILKKLPIPLRLLNSTSTGEVQLDLPIAAAQAVRAAK